MLEVDCGGVCSPEDDGSRRVTIWYAYADGTEATDTYDLSSTQAEKGGSHADYQSRVGHRR